MVSRLVLLVGSLVLAVGQPQPATAGSDGSSFVDRWLSLWDHWDVRHFASVARVGWVGPGSFPNDAAFLPGLPLLLRVLAAVGVPVLVAGLLVSFGAGVAAAVGISRLARLDDSSGRTGLVAVGLLAVAPPTVFLTAGYSEALFLALAVWVWWAARSDRWLLGGSLAAVAVMVRVHGLFLAVALGVLALQQPPTSLAGDGSAAARSRPAGAPGALMREVARRLLPLLLTALAAGVLLLAYRAATGDALAWLHAQASGWSRSFTNPVTSWRTTWAAAFGGGQPPGVGPVFAVELLAGVLALLGLVVLLVRRRWAEATYVALSVGAMVTSTWWISLSRTLLVVFPLWLLAARLLTPAATSPSPQLTWPAVIRWLPLALVAALSATAALAIAADFLTGAWAG